MYEWIGGSRLASDEEANDDSVIDSAVVAKSAKVNEVFGEFKGPKAQSAQLKKE